MPSLFRFLLVIGVVLGLGFGGLYVLATQFEPTSKEVSNQLPPPKVRK
jgi:hypothetical protein